MADVSQRDQAMYETENSCAVPGVEINVAGFYRFFPIPPSLVDVNPTLVSGE